jgi:hypothetical protein
MSGSRSWSRAWLRKPHLWICLCLYAKYPKIGLEPIDFRFLELKNPNKEKKLRGLVKLFVILTWAACVGGLRKGLSRRRGRTVIWSTFPTSKSISCDYSTLKLWAITAFRTLILTLALHCALNLFSVSKAWLRAGTITFALFRVRLFRLQNGHMLTS